MATKIRLARAGSKKRPYYRIVAADIRAPRDGRFIEKLGSYNPLLPKDSKERVTLNEERIQYWLSKGAKPTDRVLRFLDAAGLAKREARNNPYKAQPGKKAEERVEEKAARAADAKQAAAEAAATPTDESPAEEAPAEEKAAKEAVVEEVAAEETPAEEAAAEEATAADAPAEEAPAEDVVAEAPIDEVTAEEAAGKPA